jgi:hypothetical protein
MNVQIDFIVTIEVDEDDVPSDKELKSLLSDMEEAAALRGYDLYDSTFEHVT